jgi:hypothetical protein
MISSAQVSNSPLLVTCHSGPSTKTVCARVQYHTEMKLGHLFVTASHTTTTDTITNHKQMWQLPIDDREGLACCWHKINNTNHNNDYNNNKDNNSNDNNHTW